MRLISSAGEYLVTINGEALGTSGETDTMMAKFADHYAPMSISVTHIPTLIGIQFLDPVVPVAISITEAS